MIKTTTSNPTISQIHAYTDFMRGDAPMTTIDRYLAEKRRRRMASQYDAHTWLTTDEAMPADYPHPLTSYSDRKARQHVAALSTAAAPGPQLTSAAGSIWRRALDMAAALFRTWSVS